MNDTQNADIAVIMRARLEALADEWERSATTTGAYSGNAGHGLAQCAREVRALLSDEDIGTLDWRREYPGPLYRIPPVRGEQ